MIRVLIVDDSPTVRLLIRSILESDPELTVLAEARTGEEAIGLCRTQPPDLCLMDINMPGMGGYEAIRQIMSECPGPIVVLTGIDSARLLEVSFKALALGALTVLPKPRGMPATDPEARHLIAQVKTMAAIKVVRRALWLQPTAAQSRTVLAAPELYARLEPRLVAVGVSTGGPPALQVLLNGLPENFPLPLVIVQHISPGFVQGLANWLSGVTPLRCKVLEQGEQLKPGRAYLAPDDRHVIVKPSGLVWLDASEAVDGHRPSATVLFNAAARNYGAAAIGVLLTGMGQDGAQGLLAMRQAGAYTLAQDEASSVVFGMPKAANELHAVSELLPLDQIAPRLLSLVRPKG